MHSSPVKLIPKNNTDYTELAVNVQYKFQQQKNTLSFIELVGLYRLAIAVSFNQGHTQSN